MMTDSHGSEGTHRRGVGELIGSVGQKVEKTYIYKPASYEGVIKVTTK